MRTLVAGLVFALGTLSADTINFDQAKVGTVLPAGWSVAMTHQGGAPKWEIVKDPTAPSQPNLLAQTSSDKTDGRFPLAIFDRAFPDGELSVKFKPMSGAGDQAGGLVWRYRDENNYYLARASAAEKNVAVYRVQNGQRIPLLAMARHDIPANDWSILKVALRGSRFQVYLDHRRILQGWDNTYTGFGRVGLCTVGDSVAYFDDFRVYPK